MGRIYTEVKIVESVHTGKYNFCEKSLGPTMTEWIIWCKVYRELMGHLWKIINLVLDLITKLFDN